jgi:xeroderma pigmentosum group C-complementing protein
MSGLPREYRTLMRDAVRGSSSESLTGRPLKRRKKKDPALVRSEPQTTQVVKETIDLTSGENDTIIAQDAVVIDLNLAQKTREPSLPTCDKTVDDEEDDFDDDDFEDVDFEDVDLENIKPKASSSLASDVVIEYNKRSEERETKKKNRNVIDKRERLFRKTFHRNHIATMMIHGFIRNTWCNSPQIHQHLKKLITAQVYDELHPSKSIKMLKIRTRKFLDGIRHLLEKWIKYYKVTSNKGIFKHDWYDWDNIKRTPTPFARFMKCLVKGRGSRDIGAQGFVALLRAADVPSRLVYSLQPPDFTNMQIKLHAKEQPKENGPSSVQDKVLALRRGKVSVSNNEMATKAEIEMKYPVFWAEAWDTVSKTWYTIDPIVFRTIENVKTKSKLEPPLSSSHNNLTYVIGYDRQGGVRDITKRYAEKYYARTRKKRITKDEAEDIWYSGFIDFLSTRPPNRADEYEQEYFTKKGEMEGMPDNIQDFKGHPFYVLERDLKVAEVLHPKEPCGMLRVKGRNDSIPVYQRSSVVALRSPRAWYQRGRILKPRQQPMKVRQKTTSQMARNLTFDDDNEDREERLYAEFQTELYVPPPATDGLIEKNIYGNIDIFVPSMIPEGAILIQSPFAEEAAKMLEIDYAPAVVGFKFDRRQPTPRIEGIVVGEDFGDAIAIVQEQLKSDDLEKQRVQLEIRALKGWSLMLAKLRIKHRLDRSHGKLGEDDEGETVNSEQEFEHLQKEYEEYMENEGDDGEVSEQDMFEDGGYLTADIQRPDHPEECGFIADSDTAEGDFIVDHVNEGGFINEDYDNEGGFVSKDDGNEGGFSNTDIDTQRGLFSEHDGGKDDLLIEHRVDESTLRETEVPQGIRAHTIEDGFIVDEDDRKAEPDFENEMDEFEVFMEGLQDVYSHDSKEEIEAEKVNLFEDPAPKRADEEDILKVKAPETIAIQGPQTHQEVVCSGSEDGSEDFVDAMERQITESEEHIIEARDRKGTRLEEPQEPPKILAGDDELERQFNEQLEQEKKMASEEVSGFEYDEDDDDFEYDSD